MAYDQRGKLTRLGEGLNLTGFLGEDAMERTLRELALLREETKLLQVDRVLAVATSPVREAANGARFRREAESVLGMRIKVLSGREEALFSYVGAALATRLPDVLFFDLGGGSLEITYARGFRVRKILSLPIGALRMSELYGRGGGRFSKKDYERMRRRVGDILPTREELGLSDETVLLGVGGTMRAIAKYDQWMREYPLNKLHNYRLRRKSVAAINKRLRKMDAEKIAGIDALGRDRAESITAGSLVVSTMMNKLRFDEVVVSTHGLRDGVLSEHLRDPSAFSREAYDVAKANHSMAAVWRQKVDSESFVRSLASRSIISLSERNVLEEAMGSLLGLYLNTRSESLFHIILGEDSYLEHKDQIALALSLVRAKGPKTANWYFTLYRSILKGWSKESINKMAAFIRLAEIMEQTKSSLRVRVQGGAIRLEVTTARSDFPTLLLEECAQELEEATGRAVKMILNKNQEPQQAAAVAGGIQA
jgi:exopolyphosphatase/guanosine-5'-triphosphate,3'-diphosphate pyrophosphatase